MAPGKFLNKTAGFTLKSTNFYNTPTSGNWSGYIAGTSAGTYNEASTKFKVPAISCANDPNSAVSIWPGIDGAADKTVEQLGITAECEGTTPTYFAWVEEYPNKALSIDIGGTQTPEPVAAGDTITASVQDLASSSSYPVGTDYQFTLQDDNQSWPAYSAVGIMQAGSLGQDSSAEVIAEAPTDAQTGDLIPLANFVGVNFTGSEYNGSTPFSSTNSTAYNMADDGELLASTGAIDSSGDFGVTYHNSDQIATPSDPTASVDNISVGWKAVPGAVKYEVKIDGGNLNRDGTVNADQTHAIYYDVANGTYQYQVRAINGAGDSPWSAVHTVVFNSGSNSAEENSSGISEAAAAVSGNTANATGVPATPTGVTASVDNLIVGWKAVSNADEYVVAIDGPNLDKTGAVNADQTHAIYYDVAKGTFKYAVAAFNVMGLSPWTPIKSVYFGR